MALTTKHLFPFLRVMKALNIREEFKNILKNKINISEMTDEERDYLLQEKGIDMLFGLMEKMPNAEREIKSFMSVYTEKTVDELDELPIDDYIDLIKQFLAEPGFKSFFTKAVK